MLSPSLSQMLRASPIVVTMKLPPPAREAAALLKSLDASVRAADGAPGCSCHLGMQCLAQLDSKGLTYALGANAVNRVMSLCTDDAERLFSERLERHGLADASSLQILAAVRLVRGALPEAAAATASLLEHVEREQKCSAKVAAQCRAVLDACRDAGLLDDAYAAAEARWHRLLSRGIVPLLDAPAPAQSAPAVVERTLALLKPDAVRAGDDADIVELIRAHDFELVASRRWHMGERDAVEFLGASWGSAAGDRRRKFFRSMVEFYKSGECVALLLQRHDAVAEWRRLLGTRGDPAVCREIEPHTVRARFGRNKQANAAHGADSTAAATREIDQVFGHGWSEPGWAPLVLPTTLSLRRARRELRRCNISVSYWDRPTV